MTALALALGLWSLLELLLFIEAISSFLFQSETFFSNSEMSALTLR